MIEVQIIYSRRRRPRHFEMYQQHVYIITSKTWWSADHFIFLLISFNCQVFSIQKKESLILFDSRFSL